MILELLGYETVELMSPLAEQECLQRLRNSIGSDWRLFDPHEILGAVGKRSFRLSVQRRWLRRNLFQTFVYGETVAQGTATKILCRFGMQRLAAVVAGILFVAGLATVGTETINDLIMAHSLGDVLSAMVFPALFLVFVAATIFFGRVLALDEPFILLQFLRDTIEARETAPTA